MREPDRRHRLHAERLGRQHPPVAGDQHAPLVHQHRHGEAELADRGGKLRHLLGRVLPGVGGIGQDRGQRQHLDTEIRRLDSEPLRYA
jgi:hypothetical protein